MPLETKRHTANKYLVVIALILTIFGLTTFTAINFSKIPLLRSVDRIVQVEKDFSKLDSCIFKLYNAENSCRMYIATGKGNYYRDFEDEIKAVSLLMDTIEQQSKQEHPVTGANFSQLLLQKKIRTAQFIQLKRLSDSLIKFSYQVDSEVSKKAPRNQLFTTRQFKNIVQIDTIRNPLAAEEKRNFFGRIFAAISNKKRKAPDTAQVTLVKTTVSSDTSSTSLAYNKLQLKTINDYYQNLYQINSRIKDREVALLAINHLLINSIVQGLKKYKNQENLYYTAIQQGANDSILETLKNLDKFTILLLSLLVVLLVFVCFAIYKLYQHERKLILFSKQAAQDAIAKGKFLANMSHEIRTPLNSIIGFSEQLNQQDFYGRKKEQLNAIRNSAAMLLDVVNDILDFSKYEIGKIKLEKKPFSPYVAIKEVFDSLRIQTEIKGIGFEMVWETSKDEQVLGDQFRVKQIVMNLLGNAIKFTAQGKVLLKGKLQQAGENHFILKVNIIDTGIGITREDQKEIFEEFVQVQSAGKEGIYKGTGLGLSICKKIVDLHGGRIAVKSETNQGANFFFSLPFDRLSHTEKTDISSTQTNDFYDLRNKRILLAEDNALNVLLTRTILEKYGAVLDVAMNGKDAWELFNTQHYDLVLTDVQMPEMGGVELANKIRGHRNIEKQTLPVLGITANVLQEDRMGYISSGMSDLVTKPFLERELLDKIVKFI